MITFVVFYAEINSDTVTGIQKRCPSFRVPDAQRFIEMTLSSAKLFHEDGRFVLLTPEPDLELPDWVEVIPVERIENAPIYNRLEAELSFLKSGFSRDSHLLFLDYDILVNANLFEIFLMECDVILTYVEGISHPFNAGVRGINRESYDKGIVFYQEVCDQLSRKEDPKKLWWGDQEAILEMVGPGWEGFRDQVLELENGVRIGLIPEEEYNFAPNSKDCLDHPLTTKRILHFRGARKPWMLPYWSKFLNT